MPNLSRDSESILHALRDCHKIKKVWRQLGIQKTDQVFWTSNLQDWIKINSKDRKSCLQGNPPWNNISNSGVEFREKYKHVYFRKEKPKPESFQGNC